MKKEERNPILGKQSIALNEPVYLIESASVVGKKEGEGPLGNLFDLVGEDDLFGCKSWEDAESCLQRQALSFALKKRAGSRRMRAFCLRETCWDRRSPPASDWKILSGRCLVCTGPAPPVPFPSRCLPSSSQAALRRGRPV